MKMLENLKWSPKWVSHLGCVKGCLDYLGIDMTDGWLYGGTGHAFIINISEDSCPSGPTAWKTQMLFEQGPLLGYQIDGVFGSKYDRELGELQKEAWDFTRDSINNGSPVYGWEMDIPEFYVINGYDEIGYYYSGPDADDGKGPKPWNELGDTGIGIVELYSLSTISPQNPIIMIRSAFKNVLKHASRSEDWILENYTSGIEGFDTWIRGLENGKAGRFGMSYNAAVWSECRHYAIEFLVEAKERLEGQGEQLFDEAIMYYQIVSRCLNKVKEKYPLIPAESNKAITLDDKCLESIETLKEAREAEDSGLKIIEKILESL